MLWVTALLILPSVHPDLEALHQEHSNKGYEVTEPKGLPGNPPNYYFVKDPDGYKVEVIREK